MDRSPLKWLVSRPVQWFQWFWYVDWVFNRFVGLWKWSCRPLGFWKMILVCEDILRVNPHIGILLSCRQSLFVNNRCFGLVGHFRCWTSRKVWGWVQISFFGETCYDGWSETSNLMAYFILLQHVSIVRKCWFVFPCCFGDGITFSFDIVLVSSTLLSMFNNWFDFVDFFSF